MKIFGVDVPAPIVWIITRTTEEEDKRPNHEIARYYQIVDVFLSKDSAAEELKKLREKEQNSDEYEEHLVREAYYVGEEYCVTYDLRSIERTEDYVIQKMTARD